LHALGIGGPGLEQDGVTLAVELAGHRDLLGGDAVEVILDGRLAMVSSKTQTSGPNAATFAPGQIDETQ